MLSALPKEPCQGNPTRQSRSETHDASSECSKTFNAMQGLGKVEKMQRGKRGCRCRDIKITVSSGESEPSIAICNQREARGYLNVSAALWAEGAAPL